MIISSSISACPLLCICHSISVAQGGIRQQLKAATPLVTALLKGLGSGNEVGWKKMELSEEDCVVLWETKEVRGWESEREGGRGRERGREGPSYGWMRIGD